MDVEDNKEEPTNPANEEQRVSFFELFAFADRLDTALMVVGTVGAIANGLSQPLMTLIFARLINAFGTSDQSDIRQQVSQVSLMFVYLAIGSGISSLLQVSCWMVTGERQSARIRGLYLKTILRQDIVFFDTETTTGEVIGRMSGDTFLIQEAMGEKVGKFIQLCVTFFGGFVIAFVKGWLLTLVLLSSIPVVVLFGAVLSSMMSKTASQSQLANSKAGDVVEQTVGGIRTVASFTGEKRAVEKYNNTIASAYKMMVRQGLALGFGIGMLVMTSFGSFGLAVWYGSKLIIEKGYNGGQVINVIFSIMIGGMSLGQTSLSLNAIASGQAAAYKMFETIKRKPENEDYDKFGIVLKDLRGEIELKDVHFRYPSRLDVQIFSGFSLHIPSGTTAALVGQSGSGKSTVISLLERFYDPDSGKVLIDGVDLRNFRLEWIREKIGLVSQEPVLFATSIRENLAYGKENATEEQITSAIKLANAAKFIYKLPEGLDTLTGEHGTQLSVGQKQRIAIARAILKNPIILLLDEATSALDSESERIVQEALVRLMKHRTTVVVAHRLTTIRNAELIAVVRQGKIVEKGTHDELVRDSEGAYSQLIRLQREANLNTDSDIIDKNRKSSDEMSIKRSRSSRLSVRRSTSQGSYSSGRSLSVNFPMSVSIQEVEDSRDFQPQNGSNVSDKEKKPKRVSLMRLAKLNKAEFLVLVVGAVAAAVHGLCMPLFGLLLSSSIDMFFEDHRELRKDSRFWALIYAGMGLLSLVVSLIQNLSFSVAGGKLIQRIRAMTFDKVVHQDISWFDDPANSSGAIGARLSIDAAQVKSLVGDALALTFQNIATVLAALIIAFTANWFLAIIILSVSPVMLIQGYLQTMFLKGFTADAKVMYEEASQVANDAVGSIRTVASFCAEEKVMEMYHKKCEAPMKAGVRLGLISGAGLGFSNFSLLCVNALVFYIGALLVEAGKATFAEVFRVFFALTILAVGVSQTSALAPDTNKAKDSVTSIFKILDSKPKIDSRSEEGMTLQVVTGDIELEHVSFRYPTRPDVEILRGLSLRIPSGKTVALVGESGCGKSTVISLIERFYDPLSGRVTLDGVEINKFKLSWLRQQIGLVSQEPILFNETIRENIAYGKQGHVTEEEIIAATKVSNAHNFISSLPNGYETSVGERGTQLSGGQKQRIAIARAILKNPKILLLDEATSALDAESERVVQDALDRVMVDRTTVVVAHRLTTIRGADVIAVVKNGVIVEQGRHEVLMKISSGAYASLVELHKS